MEEKKLIPPFTPEEEAEDFEAMVDGLIESGYLTREQGEFGTGLENVRDDLRPIAEAALDRKAKRGAPIGNQNAKAGKHSGLVIRLNVPTIDLLYDYFALEGNPEPTREEMQDAVAYAVRQVYGRKIEESGAMIL
jgi:hypothetical protein